MFKNEKLASAWAMPLKNYNGAKLKDSSTSWDDGQIRAESIDSWLAKEREWDRERQSILKTISDLQDLIRKMTSTACHMPRKGNIKVEIPEVFLS